MRWKGEKGRCKVACTTLFLNYHREEGCSQDYRHPTHRTTSTITTSNQSQDEVKRGTLRSRRPRRNPSQEENPPTSTDQEGPLPHLPSKEEGPQQRCKPFQRRPRQHQRCTPSSLPSKSLHQATPKRSTPSRQALSKRYQCSSKGAKAQTS